MKSKKERYVAFLRGINVGGHHKVPMAELRKEMEKLKCEKVVTLLNSGNILFDTVVDNLEVLEKTVSEHLEKTFGFPIPTLIRKSEIINELLGINPFKDIVLTKDIRLYVSFLQKEVGTDLQLPWTSEDNSDYNLIPKQRFCTIICIRLQSSLQTLFPVRLYLKNREDLWV